MFPAWMPKNAFMDMPLNIHLRFLDKHKILVRPYLHDVHEHVIIAKILPMSRRFVPLWYRAHVLPACVLLGVDYEIYST